MTRHAHLTILFRRIGRAYLLDKSVSSLDIGIIEVQDQEAHFICEIPSTEEDFEKIVSRNGRDRVAKPCLAAKIESLDRT